jgi:hypothetical protein
MLSGSMKENTMTHTIPASRTVLHKPLRSMDQLGISRWVVHNIMSPLLELQQTLVLCQVARGRIRFDDKQPIDHNKPMGSLAKTQSWKLGQLRLRGSCRVITLIILVGLALEGKSTTPHSVIPLFPATSLNSHLTSLHLNNFFIL